MNQTVFPNIVAKNQFGETQNLRVLGGSYAMWCNFIVDKTNGNGLGIRSLKSSGQGSADIKAVYMATSASPATGNPMGSGGAGIILVEFAAKLAGYITGTSGLVAQLSGTPINVTSALTPGSPYSVVSVGTTTLAGWQSIGWLGSILPTVGASFVNTSATPTTGTGAVEAPLATGPSSQALYDIYPFGDPNQTVIGSSSLVLGVFGATASGTTTPELVTPSNGMVVGLTFNVILAPGSLI
jgi:hypothetical protein